MLRRHRSIDKVFRMAGGYEYWMLKLPAGRVLRGETDMDAINRELAELVGRGWEVHSFSRASTIGPADFLMVRAK